MIAKVQSLIRAGGPRDPDRLALSVAIAAAADARRAVDAARASRGRALRFVDESEARLSQASAGVVAARDALARETALAATEGTRLAPSSEMKNARAEEQDAIDNLDAARAALAAVEETIEGPADDLKLRDRRVDEAAKTVLSRHIEAAISDVSRLKASLFDALSVLHLLQAECVPQWPPNPELSRLRSHLQIPARNGVVWEIDYEANQGAALKWAKYAEELKISADAEPPSI